jgi:hypothetical protein
VLPLLVVVWAATPWLPCCQEVSAQDIATRDQGHSSHTRVEHSDAAGLAIHADHAAVATAAPVSDSSTEPHAGATQSESPDPLCADVEKNHHDTRTAAASDIAPAGPSLILPILPSLIESPDRPADDPPPVQRRPLHLAKSVLLI